MTKKPFLALLFLFLPAIVHGGEYQLTPGNTSIVFEMDTTWHRFSGKAPAFKGLLNVDDVMKPSVVSGKVVIQAAKMNTDDEARDEKMRTVAMEVGKFAEILYEITGYADKKLQGTLTIKGVAKPVVLSLAVDAKEKKAVYTGTTTIRWKDYGVKDPSIFIAKVYDDVVVTVTVSLPVP